jgi:hypothetical protein
VDKTHGARRYGLATCTFRDHAAKQKKTRARRLLFESRSTTQQVGFL